MPNRLTIRTSPISTAIFLLIGLGVGYVAVGAVLEGHYDLATGFGILVTGGLALLFLAYPFINRVRVDDSKLEARLLWPSNSWPKITRETIYVENIKSIAIAPLRELKKLDLGKEILEVLHDYEHGVGAKNKLAVQFTPLIVVVSKSEASRLSVVITTKPFDKASVRKLIEHFRNLQIPIIGAV